MRSIMKTILLRRVHILIIITFLSMCISNLHAQQIPNVSEAQVLAELEKRGLDENEVREALLAEGIDPDKLQSLTPEELVRMRGIIERLTEEKKENKSSGIFRDTIPTEEEDIIPLEDDMFMDSTMLDTLEIIEVEEDTIPTEIYGQQLFRESDLKTFEQSTDIKVPDTYILGSGDEITISIFGASQVEEKHEIGSDGYIRIFDGSQRVLLSGISLGAAKEKLYKTFKNYARFNRGEFQVTLNYTRTVSIGVWGNVFLPGDYTLPAINSAINALMAAKGPNNQGSLRNIELIKANGGQRIKIDIYEYLTNPNVAQKYYLEDNDIIIVPDQENVVTITGAITRPLKYELIEEETIDDLLLYCGGFEAGAYKKVLRLERIEGDRNVIKDIPYRELKDSRQTFKMLDGDHVRVDSINTPAKNFVQITGSVLSEGLYERRENMRISDLVRLAGLKEEARTDKALLTRLNADSTRQLLSINLEDIINGNDKQADLLLQNRDSLTIWDLSRFTDEITFSVSGAIREPGNFQFDNSQSIKVSDAVILAGGLKRDASSVALIHQRDPIRPNYKKYISIDIREAIANPNSAENVTIDAFDKLEILSENFFEEDAWVHITGAVNNPGKFQYGEDMTLEDAMALARGFKLAASTNNIEIARIIIQDNQPTKTTIANRELSRDFTSANSKDKDFKLNPFDHITIKFVPEFELQRNVRVVGEVTYPGTYSLTNDNERIFNLIDRAGGLTREAFTAGAKLFRSEGDSGYIVMRLDEVMENKTSRYNYILKEGDRIEIPKQRDFVTIQGATRVREFVSDEIIGQSNSIKVAWHKGKSAKFYVDYYAGGIAEGGKKSLIFVEHPNGEVKDTKRRFPFGYKYPEVQKGSTITVRRPPPKPIDEEGEKEEIDWTKVLGDSVAQAMSILTLILLIQRLD